MPFVLFVMLAIAPVFVLLVMVWAAVEPMAVRGEETRSVASRREVGRKLGSLDWEILSEAAAEGGIVGGYGPYRLAVGFDPESGEPNSVIAQMVGDEALFTRRWEDLESLPTPEKVVGWFSKRRDVP